MASLHYYFGSEYAGPGAGANLGGIRDPVVDLLIERDRRTPNLSPEKSAISLSDFEYGEPQVVGVEKSPTDGTLRVTGSVPVAHRKPSGRELMARMGTALVAGMAGAFACEVGMKAILVTRLDGAAKTHDLLKLYRELPDDSRRRLEGDFPEIADVLGHSRETFGRWRYFEQGIGEDAIRALVDTDRVWGLGKAALRDRRRVRGRGPEL